MSESFSLLFSCVCLLQTVENQLVLKFMKIWELLPWMMEGTFCVKFLH